DAHAPWRLAANLVDEHDEHALTADPHRSRTDDRAAIVTVQHGAFALEGQLLDYVRDDTTAGTPGEPADAHDRSWAVEARFDRDLARGLALSLHVDALGTDGAGGPFAFSDHLRRGESNLTWDGWARQSWLAGVEYSAEDIERGALAPLPPPRGGPPIPGIVVRDQSRDIASF